MYFGLIISVTQWEGGHNYHQSCYQEGRHIIIIQDPESMYLKGKRKLGIKST